MHRTRAKFEVVTDGSQEPGGRDPATGVSGMDLVRHVNATAKETPVVLITAFGGEEIARAAVAEGAFAYVPKPFNNHEIRAVVERALASRR